MSPNEKRVLKIIKERGRANAVTIRSQIRITVEYADYLCKGLLSQGYLEVDHSVKSRHRAYRLSARGEDMLLL